MLMEINIELMEMISWAQIESVPVDQHFLHLQYYVCAQCIVYFVQRAFHFLYTNTPTQSGRVFVAHRYQM